MGHFERRRLIRCAWPGRRHLSVQITESGAPSPVVELPQIAGYVRRGPFGYGCRYVRFGLRDATTVASNRAVVTSQSVRRHGRVPASRERYWCLGSGEVVPRRSLPAYARWRVESPQNGQAGLRRGNHRAVGAERCGSDSLRFRQLARRMLRVRVRTRGSRLDRVAG